MSIELVIFDMDGLMFNSEDLYFKSWKKAIEEMGFEPSKDIFIKSMGLKEDIGRKVYEDHYGEELDSAILAEKTLASFRERLEKGELKPQKGLLELIDYLNENNVKKVIASSSPMEDIYRNIKLTGLKKDNFNFIISGAQLKESKPNPEIFNKVCEILNIKKENTIVLEDSINGVRASYNANIKCIMIPDIIEPNNELIEKSHRILENLNLVINYIEEINNN